MRVTNWCRKLRFTLVAAGIAVPGVAAAQVITLGDPSFEAYTVPGGTGYAYAQPPNGTYRPTSAWVDDLDSPPGYIQDNSESNWLYSSAYAEDGTVTKRPAPRTGNQAMHGLFNYNAQETAAVFEANKSYTFTMWAQNDELLNETNGVFLYVFDGNVPFSESNSLSKQLYTQINQRQPGMTEAQSKANWTQLTLQHHVRPGAPEIGHPVGVGFFARKDSAVDDAALRADPIENFLVYLEVNTTTGQVTIKNQTGGAVAIDYYEIISAGTTGLNGNSLNATAWNSFQEQNLAGFPAGNGTGNGWEQFGGVNSSVVGESHATGSSSVANNASIGLGAAFRPGFAQDLIFQYGQLTGGSASPDGDFNGDNKVDAADYVVWRKSIGSPIALDLWRANFGAVGGPSGPSTVIQGFVRYVSSGGGGSVPEPTTVVLVGLGISLTVLGGRGTSRRE